MARRDAIGCRRLRAHTLRRRAELQTIAPEDISHRLQAVQTLVDSAEQDAAKVHETLRDLVRVFESLADDELPFQSARRQRRSPGKPR